MGTDEHPSMRAHEQIEEEPDPVVAALLRGDRARLVEPVAPTRLEDGSMALPNGVVYDPEEFLPGKLGGLLARCQQGRWDGDPGSGMQCDRPAKRGMRVCTRHGGTAVAKARLNAMVVPVVDELIHIALNREEKATDRLRAIDSILDRVGGMPRQAEISSVERRESLLDRLQAIQAETEHEVVLELSEADIDESREDDA